MKLCPVCQSRYDDITLSFCLEDGTPLVVEQKQSSIDTISFNSPVTIEKNAQTDDWNFTAPDTGDDFQNLRSHIWQTQNSEAKKEGATQPAFSPPPPQVPAPASAIENETNPGKKTSKKILVAALPIVLAVAGGAGFFLYRTQTTAPLAENSGFAVPDPVKITKDVSVAPANSVEEKPAESPGSDSEKVKAEVAEFVESWKKSAESRDPALFLAKYAAEVDYFEKENASPAEIRAAAGKIFAEFEEIEISLSNLKIASTDEGTRATAVFDKKWLYEGKEKIEEGKTHTKLELRKEGENWKIIEERNLKVYFEQK